MRSVEEGALSGAFVIRHREFLQELLGPDTARRILSELSPEAFQAIKEAKALEWVPVEAVEALFVGVARHLRRDAESVHAEFSSIATERTIRTVWRVLIRLTTDAQLVSQTPVLYRKAWNRGTLTAQLIRPGHAVLTLASWPGVPEFTVRGVQLAVEKALLLAGRKGIRITWERIPDGARYSAAWD